MPNGKLNILILDDDHSVANFTAWVLSQIGVENSRPAYDKAGAFRLLGDEDFDILISGPLCAN